jgi:hypothetical protein
MTCRRPSNVESTAIRPRKRSSTPKRPAPCRFSSSRTALVAAVARVLTGLSLVTTMGYAWRRFARSSGMEPLRAISARISLRRRRARGSPGTGS